MNKKLEPCPHCGGSKLKIDKKSRYAGFNGLEDRVDYHTFSVRCNGCHARGPAAGGKVISRIRHSAELPSWATTDEKLEARAIAAWNRRAATEANDPLTMEELNTRREPVWCACDSFDGEGGYWCLCRNGEITPPSCRPFLAKDRPNWVFYRRPPEGM